MSNRLNNFQTFFDECHQVNGNFDHHVIASPALHYSVHSGPKCTQYQQHSKMPGLLRLDSVGEVSTVKLPADRNPKPLLRNSKSADYDTNIVSKRNKFSSKSNMASVKSLTWSPSTFHYGGQQLSAPVFTKAHSVSQMPPQLDSTSRRFCGLKNLSSLDFSHQGSDKMHSPLIPARLNGYNTLFDSPSNHKCTSMGTTFKPLAPVSFTSSPYFFSTIAAMYKPTQSVSNGSSPVFSQPLLLKEEKNNTACQASQFSSKTEVKLPTDEEASRSEKLIQLPLDNCQLSEEDSSGYDTLKRESDRKATLDETSHSSLKTAIDHSSILSAPRKITKKGRPSLKKQKKRRREKYRHETFPLVKESSNSSSVAGKVDEEPASECANNRISHLEDIDNPVISVDISHSLLRNSVSKESSSVKAQSKCPIASIFFGRMSADLEEIDDDSDYGHDNDNYDGSDEWSVIEDDRMYINPMKCPGLNVALNLDLIFKKKHIPSLKSVFRAEESDSDSETLPLSSSATSDVSDSKSSVLNTSKDDSFDDTSVEFDAPLASSELKCFGFTTGLSLDSLFTKKRCLGGPSAIQVAESTFNVIDDLSSSDNSQHFSSNIESCLDAISKINAKWDEDYPTAGFRSCQCVSTDEITDSSIKVHFAAEPDLLTVYVVGTEERAGSWHLDRQRFERRIHELEEIISPILEASHRAKILEQNQTRKSVE